MPSRIIQVVIKKEFRQSLEEIIQNLKSTLIDYWAQTDENNQVTFSLLAPIENTQNILDALQTTLNLEKSGRIVILPVEATLPKPLVPAKPEPSKDDDTTKDTISGVPREELYEQISENSKLTWTFVLLIILSTIVASLGLLEDDHAVLIGAMVIAPLLGPNLAIAFATALGDLSLMLKSLWTSLIGIGISLLCAIPIGFLWPYHLQSPSLLTRTDVGYAGVMIALASGAAAVLSMTTGLSGILVGVMVAVALLPPICAMGIYLGVGVYSLAFGAFLLLIVNLVCINLSANLVFFLKGIGPTRWYEKQKAKKATFWQFLFLGIAFFILLIIIYLRHGLKII